MFASDWSIPRLFLLKYILYIMAKHLIFKIVETRLGRGVGQDLFE